MGRLAPVLPVSCLVFVSAAAVAAPPAPCHAQPVQVSIELVEFDCSRCPDLYDRYTRAKDPAAAEAWKALEKGAIGSVQIQHTQWVELGTRARHATRIGDREFTLDLLVKPAKGASYAATVEVTFARGQDAPGAQVAVADSQSLSTTVSVVPEERICLGSSAGRARDASGHSTAWVSLVLLRIDKRMREKGVRTIFRPMRLRPPEKKSSDPFSRPLAAGKPAR